MQVHPVAILLIAVLLRVGCFVAAVFRMFGLSLAGGADLLEPHLPALALLYFAISPKPGASAKVHLAISSSVYLTGLIVDAVEIYRWPEIWTPRAVEMVLLTLSLALHIAYVFWKDRDPEWGKLQYL
jgi:hypothetical protein